MYVCMYVCMCVCVYVCMYVCIYVYIYISYVCIVCVYIYVCMHIYIHIYILLSLQLLVDMVGRRARTNTAHVQGLPSVSVMYVCGHALRFVTFVFLTNIFQYGWVYGPSLSNEVARLIDEHLERLAEENTIRNLKATWQNETQKCFSPHEDAEESGTTFRDFAGIFAVLWVCGGLFILWRYLQDNVQSLQRCFPRQFQPQDADGEPSFSRTNSLSQAPAATVGQLSNFPASGPSASTPQIGNEV